MSEQEIREGMLLAVWDEPPLDFDPDVLIKRVEQKKSRRRALVGVGVATAVIAVASFALPGLLPRDGGSQLASEGQATTSAPPSESVEKKAQRIGDKLAEKLALKRTDFKEIYAEFHPGQFTYPPYSTPTTTRRNPSDPDFSGYVYLNDNIGPTALRVTAGRPGFSISNFCVSASYCHESLQKDGSTVFEAEYLEGGSEVARAEVVRRFSSGYVVQISSHNYNPASGQGLRQTVPVRVGVLTELVTEPSITWE
ncbi:hypothetical protein [Lentzea flava]|uniref:Uncharacterized protein n=1 Tax=Lentzea flava TaxID=103732 RepID=A0ABQ2V5B8_9PSEU|nr:hypothetical protein [Lentzea flava]MCP2203565.1 hypothetical protein [Lentzea flava]GGU69323.1 hypothetical protein GCM10010178_71400 [Lentzea flava]